MSFFKPIPILWVILFCPLLMCQGYGAGATLEQDEKTSRPKILDAIVLNNISPYDFKAFSSHINKYRNPGNIKTLSVSGDANYVLNQREMEISFDRFPALTIVELPYCPMGDRGLLSIVPILRNLEKLNLQRNHITDVDLATMFAGIYEVPNLRTLTLSNNPISSNYIHQLPIFENLTELRVDRTDLSNRGLCALSSKCPALQLLSAESCLLSDDAAEAISVNSPNLIELILDENDIGPKGAEHLAHLQFLVVLHISGNRIQKTGLNALLQGLPSVRKIRAIGNDIMMAPSDLRDSIPPHLEDLDLSWNMIDAWAEQLSMFDQLRMLTLDNARVNQKTVDILRTELPDCVIKAQSLKMGFAKPNHPSSQ
ncbi:MAG: leucine-rich repeat domain-containing protein [Alphaproteobacteria bacterium]|nr:leucine-rich repeat domain-containing protein [Alphaproteobacteria bacterium]